jgi:hypothetical protein
MNKLFKYISGALLLALISNIKAQEYYPLPEDLRYETNITEPLNLRKGYFNTELSFTYMPFSSYFDEQGKRSYLYKLTNGYNSSGVSSYRGITGLVLNYGFANWLMMEVYIPYIYSESQIIDNIEAVIFNYTEHNTTFYKKNGIGDLITIAAFQFIQKPELYSNVFLGLTWPTGSKKDEITEISETITEINKATGSDEYIILSGWQIKKILYPLACEISSSIQHSFGNDFYEPWTDFSINGKLGIMLNDWFTLNNDWEYLHYSGRKYKGVNYEGRDGYQLNSGIYIQQQVKRFRFTERFLFPVSGKGLFANCNLQFVVSYKL